MDNNIILKKLGVDKIIGWLSLELVISSNSVLAKTVITSSNNELMENAKIIEQYIKSNGRFNENICFGLNINPSVYIKLTEANKRGQIKLDVKLELKDCDGSSYNCFYPVMCELGALEQFSKKIISIANNDAISEISLYS